MEGDSIRSSVWLRPRPVGVVVALAWVASSTGLIYPLKELAPVVSLGVVYLVGVLAVAAGWGLVLGLATAVASAAAFNYFHIPPTGGFTIGRAEDSVALVVYLTVQVYAGVPLTEIARHCGTSLAMLDKHYAGVIANYDGRRIPADEQIGGARSKLASAALGP